MASNLTVVTPGVDDSWGNESSQHSTEHPYHVAGKRREWQFSLTSFLLMCSLNRYSQEPVGARFNEEPCRGRRERSAVCLPAEATQCGGRGKGGGVEVGGYM